MYRIKEKDMKSKIVKYSLIFALLPVGIAFPAQAQVSVFPLTGQSQPDPIFQGGVSANPMSQGQVDYLNLIWKDSRDYAKSAQQSYYRGDYKEAEILCKKSMDKAPLTPDGKSHQGNWQAGDVLAMVYIREQKYAEAIKVYDDLHASNPRGGSYLEQINLALCYLRLGKYDEAGLHYRNSDRIEARHIQTNDPPASDYAGTDTPTKLEASILMNRGVYMAGFGSKSEGLIDLRQAHVLLPDNPIVAYYLVRNLSLDKDTAESLALYKIIEKNGHEKSMVDEAKNDRIYLEYVIAHPGQ
jgi:tetratricopeptide (TPR) repeat protein